MPLLKRDRVGVVARFMGRVHELDDKQRKRLKAAAKEAQAGNERPLIDFIKALVSDPENIKALLKLLPLLLPLLMLL